MTTDSLLKNSIIVMISLIISAIVLLLLSIVVARSITVAEFGMYAILISTQSLVSIFSQFGTASTLTKFVSEYRVRDKDISLQIARFGTVIVLSLTALSMVIYVALSEVIGIRIFNEPRLVTLIPISALAIFSSSLITVCISISRGFEHYRLMALSQAIAPIFSFALIIILAPLFGLIGIFIGLFLGPLGPILITIIWLERTDFPFISKMVGFPSKSISKDFMRYSSWAFLSAAIAVPLMWIGNAELAVFGGFEAMGHFGIANVFYNALGIIPIAIGFILLPKISELSVNSNEKIFGTMKSALKFLMILVLPICLIGGIFSREIILILYGSDYLISTNAAMLMILAGYFFSIATIVSTSLAGIGKMNIYFQAHLVWGGSFLMSIIFLIPVFRLEGLCTSYVISYGLLTIILSIFANTKMNINGWIFIKEMLFGGAVLSLTFSIAIIILNDILLKILLLSIALTFNFIFYSMFKRHN